MNKQIINQYKYYKKETDRNASPSISIVIPTLGRFDQIPILLKSIFSSGFSGEVIIVADGCKVPVEIIETYSKVTFLSIPRSGAGAARNFGVAISKGDWLYFVDDDCVLPQDWQGIIKSVLLLEDESTGMIGGDILSYMPRTWIGNYLTKVKHLSGPLMDKEAIVSIATANALVNRNAFDWIGGFDERLHEGSEDSNLTWRMSQRFVVKFCYDIKVYHENNISLLSFIKKFFRYGFSYSKHLQLIDKDDADDGVYVAFGKITINTLFRAFKLVVTKPIDRLLKHNFTLVQGIGFYPLSLIQEIMFLSGCITYCLKLPKRDIK